VSGAVDASELARASLVAVSLLTLDTAQQTVTYHPEFYVLDVVGKRFCPRVDARAFNTVVFVGRARHTASNEESMFHLNTL
jgi:hypothetical protein